MKSKHTRIIISTVTILVIVLALGALYYRQAHRVRTIVETSTGKNVQEFSAQGVVMAVMGDSLQANINVIRSTADGNSVVTELKEVATQAETEVRGFDKPILFSQIKVGDKITVYSRQNIFNTDKVTATKIQVN